MVTAVIYPPELPQMMNDGYINAAELATAVGVEIEVDRYDDPAPGDYLCLYWDNEVASTLWLTRYNIDTAFPWQAVIPQGLVPDGAHQVWFTATDAAHNTTASGIATALVSRSYTGTLPPPVLSDALAGTIDYPSVVFNNGTHIQVPGDALSTGDIVNIYWEGFDQNGKLVQASLSSQTHTVTAGDLSGFSVLVPPSYITVIGQGSAQAWYAVTDETASTQNSASASATIDMTYAGQYTAPFFPAGSDGWLDCAECAAGVAIFVPASEQFAIGGLVAIYWQGYDSTGVPIPATQQTLSHTLVAADITNGFTVTVDASRATPIGIGYAQASYQVMSPSVPGYSALVQVRVDTAHCALLPAPSFPAAAGDNTLTGADIESGNGTSMQVTWPDMQAGDTITAFWVGYTKTPDSPVPGTSWTQTHTLTPGEAQAQAVTFHIPASFITPVGDGNGEGRYQVMFKQGGTAASDRTDVVIKINAAFGLQAICATGAPVFDPTVPVRPINRVSLSGPAGARILLSLPSGSEAYFNPAGTQIITVDLDDNGRGGAEVYAFTAGNATVDAYIMEDPSISDTGAMTFTEWKTGSGELLSYGVSTGGSADGTPTCGVYVQTTETSTATQARLTITSGSAVIPATGRQTASINVSTSHAGGFDVADSIAEAAMFTLSLPDVSQSYVTGSLAFESFATTEQGKTV